MFHEQSGLPFFSYRKIDVAVSPWYLLLMAFVIFFWGASPVQGILLALAITISLLVHEFGHAFVAQRYKLNPSIMLHAFGGYCSHREAQTDGDDARIVLAGPLAGLVLAGLVYLLFLFAPTLVYASTVTATFFSGLLWINLVWSLFNLLLPIYPLDGGRMAHLFFRRIREENKAAKMTLNLSIFVVIPVMIIGIMQFRSFLLLFLGVFILIENIQALQSGRPLAFRKSGRGKNKASDFHTELFEDAKRAMDDGDYREAARLCHHMRSLGAMPEKMTNKVWKLLGLATMEQEKWEEALRYLERAPSDREVSAAIQKCEKALDEQGQRE